MNTMSTASDSGVTVGVKTHIKTVEALIRRYHSASDAARRALEMVQFYASQKNAPADTIVGVKFNSFGDFQLSPAEVEQLASALFSIQRARELDSKRDLEKLGITV